MAQQIAKTHTDRVKILKENVNKSRESYRKNNENFNRFKSFLYSSTLTEEDRGALEDSDKSPAEVNVLESFVSRLRGEFAKQVPELSTSSSIGSAGANVAETVEDHVRYIFSDSDYEQLASGIYDDTMSGGFSVAHVRTEYEHPKSSNQIIVLDKVFDPTLTGFDPLAKKKSKSDGDYAFMLFPKYKEELEDEYPNVDFSKLKTRSSGVGSFRWKYKEGNQDVFFVCDYYEKKYTFKDVVDVPELGNPNKLRAMYVSEYDEMIANWEDIMVPPPALNNRRVKTHVIMRYKFIDSTLLDRPEETDYEHLPLVFFDGNSCWIDMKQITRPYIYNAMDAQRIKNFAASNIVTEMENARETDLLIAKESIPQEPEYVEALLNPNRSHAGLVWDSKDKEGNPNPKPEILSRNQVSAAFLQIYEMQDKTIQMILGNFDTQLGLQNNQLSGLAVIESATQSNNTAMPFVTNYMESLNQIATIIVDLLPKYYKTERTIPIQTKDGKEDFKTINSSNSSDPDAVNFDYESKDLPVIVKAGPNFDVQRNKALITITELMKVSPTFNQMINTKGIPILLDNIDIRGKDQLKQMAEKYIEEQENKAAEQGQKQDPKVQLAMEDMKIKQGELKLKHEKQQNDLKIANDKLQQSQMQLMANIDNNRVTAQLRMQESQDNKEKEQARTMIDILDHQMNLVKTAMVHSQNVSKELV
jgi:hypothetical protein